MGYSDETINYTEENIIVSYEMYDKVLTLNKMEADNMLHTIESQKALADGIKLYFNDIYDYLKKQPNIDKELIDKADSIIDLLYMIKTKYVPIIKEK